MTKEQSKFREISSLGLCCETEIKKRIKQYALFGIRLLTAEVLETATDILFWALDSTFVYGSQDHITSLKISSVMKATYQLVFWTLQTRISMSKQHEWLEAEQVTPEYPNFHYCC